MQLGLILAHYRYHCGSITEPAGTSGSYPGKELHSLIIADEVAGGGGEEMASLGQISVGGGKLERYYDRKKAT